MPALPVLIPTHLTQGRLGHARSLSDRLGESNVLMHTLRRANRIEGVGPLILIHPPGQDPMALVDRSALTKPVQAMEHAQVAGNAGSPRTIAARKWALGAWRGGLGQMTGYDELLPAKPLADALDQLNESSAFVVRADWCWFCPALAGQQITTHLQSPEKMKLVFTQTPPGLTGLVTSRDVLAELAEHHATIADTLRYNPKKPSIDPIGREVNLGVPAEVRMHDRRMVYDTPRSQARMQAIAKTQGSRLATADPLSIVEASQAYEQQQWDTGQAPLPMHWRVELTPRRSATGPITPQHHLGSRMDRPDFDPGLACELFAQLAELGDAAILFGHEGEPMLHPHCDALVQSAREAGVFGVGLETDLLVEPDRAREMVRLPLDVMTVRLNADTPAVYEQEMGLDGFQRVVDAIKAAFEVRNTFTEHAGVPWIVPKLVKVPETLKDMESFFERWTQLANHAVIEPFNRAGGLIEDRSPVPMDPPPRPPWPDQRKRGLTVLSDGSVVLCREDLLGRASLGNLRDAPLAELWQRASDPDYDASRGLDPSACCRRCQDWLNLRRPVAARTAQAPML